jgi:STAS domain
VRWFVVDASATTDIDYSAARTLRDFIGELTARKVQIAFGRVSPSLHADMQRHSIAATLGEEHIFRRFTRRSRPRAAMKQWSICLGRRDTVAELPNPRIQRYQYARCQLRRATPAKE